jgi:hypothetical protein
MADDPLEIPQSDEKDVLHIAISTAISAVPFLGGSELFKFIVTPSIEKRRERWMQTVAESIKELQQQSALNIQQLSSNEEFVTLLLQATQSAFKTHLESKHQLLKVVLIQTVLQDVSFDVKQLYMSMIDRFSPTHIHLLKFVEQNTSVTVGIESIQKFHELMLQSQEENALVLHFDNFLAFLVELERDGLLIATTGFLTTDRIYNPPIRGLHLSNFEGDKLPRLNITQLARDFIAFLGI